MAQKFIFCLILAIYPFTSFADNSACKPVNKKKIICKYRGGKWKNGKCVYKKRRRIVKRRRHFRVVRKRRCKKIVRRYVNIINSCKPKVIIMSCNKEREPKKTVPIALIQPVLPKVNIVKDKDFFDWDMGVGTFALGVFNTQEKQFLTGFYGTVVFRLWDRVSLAGFLGGSVWQDTNLYISSKLGARVYKQLTLNAGLHAFFGDFDGSRKIGRAHV